MRASGRTLAQRVGCDEPGDQDGSVGL